MTTAIPNFESPFNEEFCIELENKICTKLEKTEDANLKGFWCDGISWIPTIENQLSKKFINDNRKIKTTAWLGKSGQDEYTAIIYFGKKALSNYAKDKNLKTCIPENESKTDWIEIEIKNKTIYIKLN